MNWEHTKLSDFLTERDGRIKYEDANQLGLQRIKKIDFTGNIHLDAETDTKTDMIRVKSGDLVISGINAAKGAIAVHGDDDDVLATIHYSAYEFNSDRISVDFLKWFFKSPEFSDLLKEQIPGGIKTELKPKHILPLQVKLPKLSEQITVASRLNRFRLEHLKLEHEITHQKTHLDKLKQAILQDAIQGKLTADWRAAHPDVEPASQLLRRIQAEKARLITAKKLRPDKHLPKITDDEILFEIPTGWEWCRLGQLVETTQGVQIPKNEQHSREGRDLVRYLYISDFEHTKSLKFVADIYPEKIVKPGDLIVVNTGSTSGKIFRGVHGVLSNNLFKVSFNRASLIPDFLFNFVHTPHFKAFQKKISKGTTNPHMGHKNFNLTTIPLPPLAEQTAIMERVESLLTTCRALESEIEHSRTHAAHLLQAVLKEAFAPASA